MSVRANHKINPLFFHHDREMNCAQFIFLLVFLFIVPFRNHAQEYTFIPYNLKEGLPQSQVRCLMQDSQGFIWIGTLGGLSKFDSRHFTNYNRQDGLLNNQINTIIELSPGQMVAASNGSLAFIDGTGMRSVALPENDRESTINTLFLDQGLLWVGTENGLRMFDIQKLEWIPKDASNVFSSAHIKSIQKKSDGSICVLTKEKFYRINGNETTLIYDPNNPETTFFDFAEDASGNIWVASKNEGLIRFNSEGTYGENFLHHPDLLTNLITGVMVDRDNVIWLTSRYGFYSFDGKNFHAYTERNGLPIADVRDILQDVEGNIWIGTYGQGLLRFTGRTFSSYTTKDGLTSNAVMSILKDNQNDFWFSTFDKGICTLHNDTIVQFSLREWTDNNRIWSSIKDHHGDLWFGSSDGVFRRSNGQFQHYTEKDSLSHAMVLSIFEDRDHIIWIGTNKGLTIYVDGKFKPLQIAGAPQKKVRCIRQDKGGHIWFAAIDGVYRFNGTSFRLYSQKDGLPENSTNCLEIDDQNRIWVGTQNGIALLNGENFSQIQIDESSGSNVINFLKSTGNEMWIGTNSGLYSVVISTEVQESNLQFMGYGLDDGLRSLETNLNAVFYDSNGSLWFGCTDGVTKLDIANSNKHKSSPPPLLNLVDVRVNLQTIDWSKKDVRFDPLNGLPISPVFSYKQNHITFYFTGISTTYPARVQYQYMLEGLDDDWKAPTAADFATYSNLPFRDFVFHVRSRLSNGEWSSVAIYPFSVKPPFWLTWWFITMEAMLVVGIVLFILLSRRRARIAKREKEWFEIKSRMLALEQQSLNSSMNRHFIFNALNSIQYYINRQDRIAANRYLSDFARLIRKNLDSSQDNLTTLRDEIERLELYLKLEHMRFRDKFNYSIHVAPEIRTDIIKVPAMLIQPFLENSIWHGLLPKEESGEVKVEILMDGERLEFVISDNGIGIENSLKNKTTADNHISKGMEITQSRIELIRKSTGKMIELRGPYQIRGENGESCGTRVEIKLPTNFGELFSQ